MGIKSYSILDHDCTSWRNIDAFVLRYNSLEVRGELVDLRLPNSIELQYCDDHRLPGIRDPVLITQLIHISNTAWIKMQKIGLVRIMELTWSLVPLVTLDHVRLLCFPMSYPKSFGVFITNLSHGRRKWLVLGGKNISELPIFSAAVFKSCMLNKFGNVKRTTTVVR